MIERRKLGRILIVAIGILYALLTYAFGVLGARAIAPAAPDKVQFLLQLTLFLLLFIAMYRGHNWARWLTSILFFLGAVTILPLAAKFWDIPRGLTLILIAGLFYLISALILLLASPVKENMLKKETKPQQDAAHIFQKPRAVSENGEL